MLFRIYILLNLLISPANLFANLHRQLWYRKQFQQWLQILNFRTHSHVLDVGCGPGGLCQIMDDFGLKFSAVDNSRSMLRQAQKLFPQRNKFRFVHGDAFNLPFEDNTFDAVLSASLINIIAQPDKVVIEMARVVKPNGQVSFLVPAVGFTLTSANQLILDESIKGFSAALINFWARQVPGLLETQGRSLLNTAGLTDIKVVSIWDGNLIVLTGKKDSTI